MASELNQLIRAAEQQGWLVEQGGGGHFKFKGPNGGLVFVAASPSDHRWLLNTVSQLKRHGFEYDRGRGSKRLSVVGESPRRRKRSHRR